MLIMETPSPSTTTAMFVNLKPKWNQLRLKQILKHNTNNNLSSYLKLVNSKKKLNINASIAWSMVKIELSKVKVSDWLSSR